MLTHQLLLQLLCLRHPRWHRLPLLLLLLFAGLTKAVWSSC
jgi:hypothetical protein